MPLPPVQHGNVMLSSLQALNAVLCIAEQGSSGGCCQSATDLGTRSTCRSTAGPSGACGAGLGQLMREQELAAAFAGQRDHQAVPGRGGRGGKERRRRLVARTADGQPNCICSPTTTAVRCPHALAQPSGDALAEQDLLDLHNPRDGEPSLLMNCGYEDDAIRGPAASLG